MEKRYNLFEMKVRVENLKKKFGREYVNATMRLFSTYTSNELDLLYLTYYHIKDAKVKYNRYQFGIKPVISYEANISVIHSSWSLNGNFSHSTVDGEWEERRKEIENHWNRLFLTEPKTDPYANVLYTYM